MKKCMSDKKSHIGVYGINIQDGKILLILKARGPYKGMYDLPGGRIEKNETLEEALKREFIEETDCEISELDFVGCNEYECEYINDKNEKREFHHIGSYYIVSLLSNEIKQDSDGEDSLGAKFFDIQDINEIQITPIARPVILKVVNKKL